jgi:hypothetical protein
MQIHILQLGDVAKTNLISTKRMKPFTTVLVSSALLTCVSAQSIPLEELPRGEYYYEQIEAVVLSNGSQGTAPRSFLVLGKVGRTVVGMEAGLRSASCFKGFVQGNQIVDMTRIFPPYDPASAWNFQTGVAIDLDDYQRVERTLSERDRNTFQTCIEFFSTR